MKLKYIDLKYKPTDNDLVCEYYIEPTDGYTLEEVSEHVAGESSIGTWTSISTMKPRIAEKLKPHVYSIDKQTNEIKVAYNSELFEAGNMPEIMSSIGGNIYGMKAVRNLRLQDISFPKSILRSFKGPLFGIYGIRRMLKVKDRPLTGTIVKPKVGLNEKEHAKVAYDSWVGGLDAVKDDENLSSMKFNKFDKRAKETLKMRDLAEQETGEKKVYFANVTAETKEALRRARLVKSLGGEYIMFDIVTGGWGTLQALREADLGLAIHAHRAGHGMFTENPYHGMSMLTLAKISRLIGVDQIHIGAIVGKMKGSEEDVKNIAKEISDMYISEDKEAKMLKQDWGKIKPIFPVCSGGMHPGLIPALMNILETDIIIQCGGGVHGHKKGTQQGATAVRQAVDAALKEIPLDKYAKDHKELKIAIDQWGFEPVKKGER